MTKKQILTNVVGLSVLLIVCALIASAILLGPIYRSGWLIPVIVFSILSAALVWLYRWQVREGHFFPLITKPWLISLIPFIFILAAFLAYSLPVQGGNSTDLTFIFGAVSVVSLAFSVAVLVTLHETFHDELQQMRAAINLIQLAKNKLVFIALTPNLGYARAAYRQQWELCNEFKRVFDAKLNELLDKADKEKVEIRIGILGNPDRDYFYKRKEAKLMGQLGQNDGHDAAATYKSFTGLLMDSVERVKLRGELLNDPEKFRYVEWKENCVAPNASEKTTADIPPLGILIADNHMAIIQFNSPLLSPAPVDLRGRILRSPEEIEAFSMLVDAYLNNYKR